MSQLLSNEDKRTKYCGEFRCGDIGSRACVMGWVQRTRDLGGLIFVDLRDRSGIVQLAFDSDTPKEVFDAAFSLRAEYVVCAKGVVRQRASVNDSLPTGQVEIAVTELKLLSAAQTPPFEITENSKVRPELRLKHRYLDLRRPDLQGNIVDRSRIVRIARVYFADNGFIEIETPNLIAPTPEGARDYLVPSRVHPGKFYALPQSPQLYKQLLMLSGFDRYIQIARCFRDEDLRADRQPEFTQIDLEMSFVTQDDVIAMTEGFLQKVFREFKQIELTLPLQRMTYREAMERFGSDKPDLRFGFELKDLSSALAGCGFKVFAGAVAAGGSVRGINVKGGARFSRKEIDSLTEFVKTFGAKGLAWYKNNGGEISSSYAKFLTEEENAAVLRLLEAEEGDLLLIVADRSGVVFDSLGALRCEVAKRMGLIDPSVYKLLWVTDFPLLEYSEEDGRYYAKHHPFTMPAEEDLPLLDTAPEQVRSVAYDIVINGTEAGGGSIRIHTPEIQNRMFRALGFSEEEANAKFGFLLDAFRYGTPPHGGLAFGLDRLTALLLGLEDIRDVIAFPKVQNASELMTKCPTVVDPKALDELGVSAKPMPVKKADVIVVGGGLAGAAAALAASRGGAQVLLVEKLNCLGGAPSGMLVNPFMRYWTTDPETDEKKYLSRGIFEEIVASLKEMNAIAGNTFNAEYLKLILNRKLTEAGVELLFNSTLADAVCSEGVVRAVTAVTKSGMLRLEGRCFIDATGDADLTFSAGFPTEQGRAEDGLCQPMTLCFSIGNVDPEKLAQNHNRIAELWQEEKKKGYIRNPMDTIMVFNTMFPDIVHLNATRVINRNPTDCFDLTRADIEAREQAFELLEVLRKIVPGFEKAEILSSAVQTGVRESRRIVGEHVLTEEELKSCVVFPDAIAAGNYDIDIHNPAGSGTSHYFFPEGSYYTIPYGCLIPKSSRNLLVAGRCISTTHEAQASIRIMPIVCTLGEAAGTAAALALRTGRTVSELDCGLLRSTLENNGAFLG